MRAGISVLLLALLLAACSAANEGDNPDAQGAAKPPEDTAMHQETTSPGEARDALRVEQIVAKAPGRGPRQPRVVVAPSAAALSEAPGMGVPDSGSGVYLAAYWGRKPTGGYSLSAESARLENGSLVVELALKEPPPDAMVTQALTYPYVLAVVRGADLAGNEVVVVDQGGRELGWPVRRAGGQARRLLGARVLLRIIVP